MASHIILHATDFSEHSQAALEFASSLASKLDEELLIAHVTYPAEFASAVEADVGVGAYPLAGAPLSKSELEERNLALKKQLEATTPTLPDVAHRHVLLEGDPADSIVELAKEMNVDQIVMGSHGRQGLSRLLMGSVAELVIRRASCPVTIVKAHSLEAVEKL